MSKGVHTVFYSSEPDALREALLTMRDLTIVLVLSLAVTGCAPVPTPPDAEELERQVVEAERSFARTMAERDHDGFASFLADEAVFFTRTTPLRGKPEVAEGWRRFYEAPDAPFSWEPETVEVLDSGTLALSSGPVLDPDGNRIGTFNSVWRREAPGVWRVVFDKGCD